MAKGHAGRGSIIGHNLSSDSTSRVVMCNILRDFIVLNTIQCTIVKWKFDSELENMNFRAVNVAVFGLKH